MNELLEAVLLHLPFRDLYQVKAVCKTWKTLIEKSPQLIKRTIFVSPNGSIVQNPCTEITLRLGTTCFQDTPFEPLPLFQSIKLGVFSSKDPVTNWKVSISQLQMHRGSGIRGMRYRFHFKCDREHKEGIVLPSVLRSAYLTQPPIAALTIGLLFKGPLRNYVAGATLSDKKGITLGLIADKFAKILCQLSTEERDSLVNRGYGAYVEFLMLTSY